MRYMMGMEIAVTQQVECCFMNNTRVISQFYGLLKMTLDSRFTMTKLNGANVILLHSMFKKEYETQ